MTDHLGCCLTVVTGIDGVQPVGQNANGVHAARQRLAVGADVDAIGQSADDEHVGTELAQTTDETTGKVLAIGRAATGADDADDALTVQVTVAFIVEDDGRIVTLAQTGGVVLVGQRQRTDAMLGDERHLCCCPLQRFVPVLQRLDETRGAVGNDVADVLAMLIDGLRTAQLPVELQRLLLVEARHAGQGDGVVYLFVRHEYYSLDMST